MNIKLEKYKNNNFTLSDKHIYVQTRLKQIKYSLLQQIGGSVKGETTIYNEVQDRINTNIDSIKNIASFTTIIKLISTEAKNKNIDGIDELINADNVLNKEFTDFTNLFGKDELNMLDKQDDIRIQLLGIEKGLFKLQVKIIFNKLQKIEKETLKSLPPEQKVNITNLLNVINKKIEAMNNYIDKKEDILIKEKKD